MSLVSINPKVMPPQLYKVVTDPSIRSGVSSIKEHASEGRSSGDGPLGSSDGTASGVGTGRSAYQLDTAPAFGVGNSSLTATSKEALKRRNPKNGIAKSNSSFISRVIPHESLMKRLAEHPADGTF